MNLRDLDYFLAVAEHGQVARAAEACHVSQPTLSMQLKKLEEQLGAPLFERHPRAMKLTAAGTALLPHARAVKRANESLLEAAKHQADPLAGSFALGVFPTLAPYLLPPMMPILNAALPRLRFTLIEEKTANLLAQLSEGTLDAALLALPVDMPGLSAVALFDEPFLLACAPTHPLAKGRGPLKQEALAGTSVLLLEEGHCLRDQALSICRQIGAPESRMFRATSLETLRQMVRLGDIVTLMPKLAAQADESGHILYRNFAKPVPGRTIGLVMRASDPRGKLAGILANGITQAMEGRL